MNVTAICAVIAAFFSAFCSFLIWRTQRRNLLESIRPELILTGWGKREEGSGDTWHEVVTFNTIQNVGRGAAIHVIFFVDERDAKQRLVEGVLDAQIRVAILAPNETATIDGRASLWWNNVPERAAGMITMPINIKMWCWDANNIRHETRYDLMAFRASGPRPLNPSGDEVAPGVVWLFRTTRKRSHWSLKVQGWIWSIKIRSAPLRNKVRGKVVDLWNEVRDKSNKSS